MKRDHALVSYALLGAALLLPAAAGAADPTITYSRDVAPLLQDHCQVCHREGQMAPMPLQTYDQVRPWAKSIATQVALREMPPYFAHPDSRDMRDSLYLADEEVETIVAWARSGAPEGDAADLPPSKHFSTYAGGWLLGNPDVVLQPPQTFDVPADGTDVYQCFGIDWSAAVDLWLKGIEFMPGNSEVVHHFILFEDPDGRFAAADATSPEPGVECVDMEVVVPGSRQLEAWAPGGTKALAPCGMARLFHAKTNLVLQVHYSNQTGQVQQDRSSFAMHLAKPDERITKAFRKGYVGQHRLNIAAGDPDSRHEGRLTVREDITVYSANAHMHRRGKSMRLSALAPGRPRRRRSSGCRTTTSTGNGTTSSRRP